MIVQQVEETKPNIPAMKALSLWQPWASLVVLGLKRYETRSWKTTFRGTLVIHAGKEWNSDLEAFCREIHMPSLITAPRGGAIGTVELIGCFKTVDLVGKEVRRNSREFKFGDWSEGRWAWKLDNPILFSEPIHCAGHQRLWEVE